MSAKILQPLPLPPPKKTPVSPNLFLSNKSFHRFEQHVIFKLMTYCTPSSIALTTIDNDLLILKQ